MLYFAFTKLYVHKYSKSTWKPAFLLGSAFLAAQHIGQIAKCENEEEKKQEPAETFEDLTDEFEPLSNDKFEEVFKNTENKFIYMAWPSKAHKEYLKMINKQAAKMKAALRSTTYIINMEEQGEGFIEFLKKRDMNQELKEKLENNEFIIANRFDDVWFWDSSLLQYFQGELLEQIFNFYEGVRELHDENELMITKTPGDSHFVTF